MTKAIENRIQRIESVDDAEVNEAGKALLAALRELNGQPPDPNYRSKISKQDAKAWLEALQKINSGAYRQKVDDDGGAT